jgi:hypothetical protein
MEAISQIFNSEDIKEVKAAFKEILVEKFKLEVDAYDTWFFDKNETDQLVMECYEEVLSEIRNTLKKVIKKNILDSFEVVKKTEKDMSSM